MSPPPAQDPAWIVAIDGAGGSGKSTLARRLARELGVPYVNTGLMYRSLARRALDTGIDPSDAARLLEIVNGLRFSLGGESPPVLQVGGQTPGAELLRPDVEEVVSDVSGHGAVRRAMVEEQRRLGAGGGVIEGRDIGSVVFPAAQVKIFLDASPEVRASRRAAERSHDASAEALARRNERDARTVPHEPTPDALVIDTTELGPDDVLTRALVAVRAGLAAHPSEGTRETERDPRVGDEDR